MTSKTGQSRSYITTTMELPKRKNVRLKKYDYSSAGVYFITICTKDRKALFWDIVGATSGRPKKYELSEYGKLVDNAIHKIEQHYSNIKIDKYVIMPNHIHLLLSINGDIYGRPMVSPTVSRIINQMKGYVSKQAGYSIWQKSFIDHIIRNERDYIEHYTYIENNPVRWEDDELYSKLC